MKNKKKMVILNQIMYKMIRKKTYNMKNQVKGLILKRKLKIKKYNMNNIKSKNMSKIKIQKFH